MIEWNEMHLQIREMMRRFVESEVKPNLEALEHGDMPPYDLLRKLYRTFGLDQMAAANFDRRIEAEEAVPTEPTAEAPKPAKKPAAKKPAAE